MMLLVLVAVMVSPASARKTNGRHRQIPGSGHPRLRAQPGIAIRLFWLPRQKRTRQTDWHRMSSGKTFRPHGDGRNDRGLCNPSVAGVPAVWASPSVPEVLSVMWVRCDGVWPVSRLSGTSPGKHPTKSVGCGSGRRRQKRQSTELLVEDGIGRFFRDVDAAEIVQTCQRR